jgi:hypothetical protein
VTRLGIDPGTFRLVTQCLNHYATPDPAYLKYYGVNVTVGVSVPCEVTVGSRKKTETEKYYTYTCRHNTGASFIDLVPLTYMASLYNFGECLLRVEKNPVHKHYNRLKYERIEVKLPTFLTLAIYIEMSG